jgi:signal transduction histidine kinase
VCYQVFIVRDQSGEALGMATVSRDLTDEKRGEAALVRSEKLAAVGRLATSIAHEINNPLAAVTNLLYLALRHDNTVEVQDLLTQADRELRRVSKVATQTLRFHRQASKPQLLDTESMFESVLVVYEGRLRNSNIQVEHRGYTTKPIECFEGDIRQVLSNLLGNAIDAMPHGGRLVLRSREGTEWSSGRVGVFISVADTGCGISPEGRTKLFEAFFTTKGIVSTGLGLWISAEIMERHQGRIRLRSSQNPDHRGTVVTLFLPIAKSPDHGGLS